MQLQLGVSEIVFDACFFSSAAFSCLSFGRLYFLVYQIDHGAQAWDDLGRYETLSLERVVPVGIFEEGFAIVVIKDMSRDRGILDVVSW